jgi:hypothetical protein
MEFVPTPIQPPGSPLIAGQGLLPARRPELADARSPLQLDSPQLDSPQLDSPHVDSPRFLHALKGGIERAFLHVQHLAGIIAHGRRERVAVQARATREDLQGRDIDASAPAQAADSDTDSGAR